MKNKIPWLKYDVNKKEYIEEEEQEKLFALIPNLKYLDVMDSKGNDRLESDEEEDDYDEDEYKGEEGECDEE
ncbi:hypothetical protein GUJ93_ZPchr0002g25722 [Zizania palustris]|uniref:Uncharacterized protein n=1 Tax=Zizania palustris TaxID=103762 RepID=A0A8J5VCG6_ZIZPA|nr:hypothetical protein GUJ93_ZPchr0002g25722 [Zizania palustris]